jgi:hypothetical protein
MRKAVLFALLFATVAGAAEAYMQPKCGVYYQCHYTNWPNPIPDPSFSFFTSCTGLGTNLIRGTEEFQSYYQGNVIWDNRKFTFAKPVNGFDPYTYAPMTTWEFTINPSGPQCKRTEVMFSGNRIEFENCTDGHTRVCTTY